jgi:hypothetical protein
MYFEVTHTDVVVVPSHGCPLWVDQVPVVIDVHGVPAMVRLPFERIAGFKILALCIPSENYTVQPSISVKQKCVQKCVTTVHIVI